MNNNYLSIDSEKETRKIESFIKENLQKQKKQKVVIGISGGVDSSVCLFLLKNSISLDNIFVVSLPYFNGKSNNVKDLIEHIKLPKDKLRVISIKPMVDSIAKTLNIGSKDNVRKGNVMARIRMVALYDLARKENALVCGTENKSEHLLGYFTRFGDEASDFEPIRHLYKTQVYQLAKYLNIPKSVMETPPSANLWEGQSDEKEFGFSYQEADVVLHLYFDKKKTVEFIEKQGFKYAKKIIEFAKSNSYKHKTPYVI